MFFIATVVYLVFGPQAHPMAVVSRKAQIVLSTGAAAIGALLVWLVLTFIFGRIYCSTVCPIGTLTDLFSFLGRKIKRFNKPFSYRPAKQWSIHILLVYVICVLIGLVVVNYVIEPWNMMCNIASIANPSAVDNTWVSLGLGAAVGMIAGIISLILLAIYAILRGRAFCTDICPIGTAMGLLHEHNIYHIEIDPDLCTSCGACEDSCKASCIKVAGRYVDNSRCVRCFDCLAACPEDAIRYQTNRNRPATPLFRKTKQTPTP